MTLKKSTSKKKDNGNKSIICTNPNHESQGRINKDSQVHLDHIEKNKHLGKCKWEKYNQKKHNPDYEKSKIKDNANNNTKQHIEKIIVLSNFVEIEDYKKMGKLVDVKAVVASNTISYSVPKKINVKCYSDDEKHNCFSSKEIEITDIQKVGFTDITETARVTRSKSIAYDNGFNKGCQLNIEELEPSTIKKIRVRPIVSVLKKIDDKITDSGGNEWKAYDIYIKEENMKSYEAGKEIQIQGFVIAEPKNQKITLVASNTKKTEDYLPDYSKIKKLSKFFQGKSIPDILDWITREFSNYSKIVKREDVTIASLFTFFSPLYFEFEDKLINGWLKITIIGDSTTGKSQTVSQMIALLQNGQIISGETASMVGLGATTTQSTNSQWFVEYRALVLQDTKLLVIDGAHKLNREQWASLAEAERTGLLKITKAAKGEAHARTRQIKIMNPVSDDYKTTRPMKSFFHSAQSIENSLQIQNIARQDLTIFVNDNVSSEFINVRNEKEHDKKLGYYSELLKLCWNQQYTIVIEDSAYDEILLQSTRLEKKFKCEEIPLITNDQKYKLIKLSIALASITLSFDANFTKLTVTKQHVRYVSDFINTQYHNAGLDLIANNLNDIIDESVIGETVFEIKKSLSKREPEVTNEFCKDVIIWTAQQRKFTRDQLKTQFDLSENHELRPLLATLQTGKLITSLKGFSPTKKLIEIGKSLLSSKKLERGVSCFTPDNVDNLDRQNTDSTNEINDKNVQKSNLDDYSPDKSDNSSESLSRLTSLSTIKGDTPLSNSENNFTENNTIVKNLEEVKSKLLKSNFEIFGNGTVRCKLCKGIMDIPSAINHTCSKRGNPIGNTLS